MHAVKEIEVKILGINRKAVVEKLIALGARKTFDDELHAIYYDLPDSSLKKSNRVLRLRKEGEKIFLTVKLPVENVLAKEREEYEAEVCRFEEMKTVLEGIGYTPWLEMRKQRTRYEIDGIHVELDRYCGQHTYIPEFLEIEGRDTKAIFNLAEALGFSKDDCRPWDITELIEYYAHPNIRP